MKQGRKKPELFEILQASKAQAAEGGESEPTESPVESLAKSLEGEEPLRGRARTFEIRYDTALVLLAVVLVMMVVSYVLGMVAERREQERIAASLAPEVPGNVAEGKEDLFVVQVMSGGKVTREIIDRYRDAQAELRGLEFTDVQVHVGRERKNIYLTVGLIPTADPNDSRLVRLASRLEGLNLREGSELRDCRIKRLRAIQGSR